jgi:hypothetical protein
MKNVADTRMEPRDFKDQWTYVNMVRRALEM